MKVPAIDGKFAEITQPKVARLYSPDPAILVATNDIEIRRDISPILEAFPVKAVWAEGIEGVKRVLSRQKISLCLCGFWLLDGTYRDVVRLLRFQCGEVPAVIVCAPSCPDAYRDYLSALKISAFDFISHPYRTSDMEKILQSATGISLRPPTPIPPLTVPEAAGLQKAS